MNVSKLNASLVCERDTSITSILIPCLYAALFLLAVPMNALAAWIFFQIHSSSTFVFYLKNVVVADLLMTVTLPLKVLTDAGLGSWHLRAFYCRYSAVLFYSSMYVGILLLGLISLDRYLKIVHPFGKSRLQRLGVARVLCAVIWLMMMSLALPNVVLSNRIPKMSSSARLRCSRMKGEAGLSWHEGFNYFCQLLFWGTLSVMLVCYTFISRKVLESYRMSRSNSVTATKQTTCVSGSGSFLPMLRTLPSCSYPIHPQSNPKHVSCPVLDSQPPLLDQRDHAVAVIDKCVSGPSHLCFLVSSLS
ncbi:P2Y purinoceptor 13 isoform X2 [Triplophysa dalaica]|uniref:P2Y purinoceptor 13 isoform X2 n=1 Tax=Triplophysa dalaica TaxID=1582913 RepID=UPI0024DF34BC|nr:P2Y purinoceptor 13 isoform X2 [Triplophysa dalaica]